MINQVCAVESSLARISPTSRWTRGLIDFTAKDLVRQDVLTVEQHDDRMSLYSDILASPRRLGGVMLFDGFKLTTTRINYNARDECSLTHAEMAELERLLGDPPEYSH